jgi:hypothetical protein
LSLQAQIDNTNIGKKKMRLFPNHRGYQDA